MTEHVLDNAARNEILNICREVAFPNDIVAASIYNSNAYGRAEKKNILNVLLILSSPKLTLKYQVKSFKDTKVSILAVDQKTFERDVERDWLGGLIVENMLIPYEPLLNGDFLKQQEIKAKKRIITEILGNLVLKYPEMSHELIIKPEYFMFEAMARKASLYPPIIYRFLNILRGDLRDKNWEFMMEGFKAALKAVAREGFVTFSDGYVRITKRFIDSIQRKKLRVVNLLRIVRNAIFRHSLEVFPKMMRSLIEDYILIAKRFVETENYKEIPITELEDPKKNIFIPTSLGLVSLSDKATIEDFVKRTVPNGNKIKMKLEKLGSVLNTVYTLRLQREKKEEKIIVKMFKDWYGWKWFPLALWTLGTRGFAVLGRSRLEKEYAINRFLSTQGFNVPQIIYVSPKEQLIFQEYVEGEILTKIIKQICSSKEETASLTDILRKVGREIAKVHKLDVALGDCKPENIIITQDGRIFFVDLEQAERGGDQAWDIAELLYYSGHHAFLSSMETAEKITREFIEGYLEAGGKIENVKKARSPRYIKVFSFFTPPHILFAISNTCGEIVKSLKTKK